ICGRCWAAAGNASSVTAAHAAAMIFDMASPPFVARERPAMLKDDASRFKSRLVEPGATDRHASHCGREGIGAALRGSGAPPRQREGRAEAAHHEAGRFAQTADQGRASRNAVARACRHYDHRDIRERIEQHRYQPERCELQRDMAMRGFDELWNE